MRSNSFRDEGSYFFGFAFLATIVLLFGIGCQPQMREALTPHASHTPSSPPSELPGTGIEMVQPTATFAVAQVDTQTVLLTPLSRRSTCLLLESRLYDLTVAEDPATFAQTAGLFYENGATRVVIQLAAPDAESAFLADYGAEVERYTSALIQARVPLEMLCPLADDDRVQSIRTPHGVVIP